MGVTNLRKFCSSSLCMIKSINNKPNYGLEVNQRKMFATMASTLHVDQFSEVEPPKKLTGDSFIRAYIKNLSPNRPNYPDFVKERSFDINRWHRIELEGNKNPQYDILREEVEDNLNDMVKSKLYSDPDSHSLCDAIARDLGLESNYILVGCGAHGIIDLIMRCVLEPGDKIVSCPPTFTMCEFYTHVNGASVLKVPRNADFSLNIEEIIKVIQLEKPKCIILTSPNNPDGSIISDEILLKILNLPILVILDEAYIEFSGLESRMKWVKQHENLIVLQIFNKRAGSGYDWVRIGYGAFPVSISEYLWRAKPYNEFVAAELVACDILEQRDELDDAEKYFLEERETLFKLLEDIPYLRPIPSYANFILCEVTSGRDAKKLKEDLAKMNVFIRHYDSKELKDYVRISVGINGTNKLIEGLEQFI